MPEALRGKNVIAPWQNVFDLNRPCRELCHFLRIAAPILPSRTLDRLMWRGDVRLDQVNAGEYHLTGSGRREAARRSPRSSPLS